MKRLLILLALLALAACLPVQSAHAGPWDRDLTQRLLADGLLCLKELPDGSRCMELKWDGHKHTVYLSEFPTKYLRGQSADGGGGDPDGFYSAKEIPLLFDGVTVDETNLLSIFITDPTAPRTHIWDDKSGTSMLSGTDQNWATTGTITANAQVTTKTQANSPYTASATDVRRGVITNTGASGALEIDLPAAVKGMVVIVILDTAQDVDIDPNGTDQILGLTNAAGDAISSDAAAGSFITLVSVVANQWRSAGSAGTWSDVN